MKMYVWDDHEEVFVVAHAGTVAQARDLALANIEEQVWEGDTHRKFAGYVTNVQPTIWMGPNADATLKVDGMVADLQIECNRHASKCDELMRENARLRQALEDAPHDLTCHSVTERHIPGFTHYETDIEDERCPRYHFKCGPCDCWKAALARTPEAPK